MQPPVSVVIASHGRPDWLSRCLTAVGQLDYPNFEVVIAADLSGRRAIEAHQLGTHVKLIPADKPNIAMTRNAAIAHASGEYVAFIDDDAVPEPLWLRHHMSALATTDAQASLGYVRGRNGISFQSRVDTIDTSGRTYSEDAPGMGPATPTLAPDRCVKLIGTNFAMRLETIRHLGGFDPAFRFFHDDTDLSIRFAEAGYKAVVTPLAEVHHATAASTRRTQKRFPTDLVDVARSTAIFLRKHEPLALSAAREALFHEQEKRLHRHLVLGTCEPRDVTRARLQLAQGWSEGEAHDVVGLPRPKRHPSAFKAFPTAPSGHQTFFNSLLLRRRSTVRRAVATVKARQRATVFSYSLTPWSHRVLFTKSGIWLHTGGLFGRSERDGPSVRWCTFADRVKAEITRVEMQRGIRNNGTRVG